MAIVVKEEPKKKKSKKPESKPLDLTALEAMVEEAKTAKDLKACLQSVVQLLKQQNT